MKEVKIDGGAQPLTLQVVNEVQPRIAPVRKLKPKPKPKAIKPVKQKVKVVYKESMERMTNRDWTGVKKRLRYLFSHLERQYNHQSHVFLLNPKAAPPKAFQRKRKKELNNILNAIQLLLDFDGQVNGITFTKEDFRPSNHYRFFVGPNAIYASGYDLYPTQNLDKHPDAKEELERKKKEHDEYWKENPNGAMCNKDKNKHAFRLGYGPRKKF